MFADPQINTLLLDRDFWYILGISLIILDVVIGLDFFALAFGLGAVLTGLSIDAAILNDWLQYWEQSLLLFSLFSLASIALIKWLTPKGKGTKDINDY